MTQDQIFRVLILLTMGTSLSISIYFRRQADKQGGKLDPSGNRVLLTLRLAALIFVAPLIAFLINTDSVDWARYRSPVWLRWIGFTFSAISVPALYWLFSTIGKNISPTHATRKNHQLITDGPYRWVRHPLYTVGFILYLGVGWMATMWWLLFGLVVLMTVLIWRTGQEEENLLSEFGEEYQAYMSRTGRFLPKLARSIK